MSSVVVAACVSLSLVVFAYFVHFLTLDGSAAAFFIGVAVFSAGLTPTLQLLAFFFLGSLTTKYKHAHKEGLMPYRDAAASSPAAPIKAKRGRDRHQVLATGLIPALLCVVRVVPASVLPSSVPVLPYVASQWSLLYAAFMATNLADTLASELGMLSSQAPLLITSWRERVQTGVDGGVTLLGTAASIAGGAIIGLCAGSARETALMALVGMNGSVVDSVLGVLLQSRPQRAEGATLKPRALSVAEWESSNALVNIISCSVTCVAYLVLQWAWSEWGLNVLPSVALFDCALLLYLLQGFVPLELIDNAALLLVVAASVFCYAHRVQVLAWWLAVFVLWTVRPYMAGPGYRLRAQRQQQRAALQRDL